MAGELILITGATGHIGFRTLVLALEAGYRIRAAVRNEAKAQQILNTPSIKRLNPGTNLTFVTVPDLTVPGAYDDAVRDVKRIIHLASPIPAGRTTAPEHHEDVYITPAIKGTLGILESAAKTTTGVQRIVITSSIAAQLGFGAIASGTGVWTASSRTPTPHGPFTVAADFEAYVASKVAALNATEAWMAEHGAGVGFDVVHIAPSFVLGGDELATTVRAAVTGSNGGAAAVVLGGKAKAPLPGTTVHLDDAARAHVRALDPKVAGNQIFVVTSHAEEGVRWEDALEVVAKAFPDAVSNGILPNNGTQSTTLVKADTRKTEEVLGFKHLTFDDQIKSMVGHLLEVAKAPGQSEELDKVKADFAKAG